MTKMKNRNIQHTGVAPTDDSFTVIVPGNENSIMTEGPLLTTQLLDLVDSSASVILSSVIFR